MAKANAVHTLVKGDSFITFLPEGARTQVRVFRGYDIEEVQTVTTAAARSIFRLRRADGYVPATRENVTHESVGHLLYEGRY